MPRWGNRCRRKFGGSVVSKRISREMPAFQKKAPPAKLTRRFESTGSIPTFVTWNPAGVLDLR